MNTNDHIVFVVDDDQSICKSFGRLLRTAGHPTETFGSLTDFLGREPYGGAGCLVLDVCLPEMSGLDASQKLSDAKYNLPTVFVSGYADIPTSVRAMKSGAIDYLSKPVDADHLLTAVRTALAKNREQRMIRADLEQIHMKLASLTPREHEVFRCVVSGQLNKQTAARLGVGVKTVKVHRASIMQKMQTRTLANLVRVAEKVGNARADVRFISADMPEAERTVVHLLVVLAEWERDQILTRTKAAETRAQSLKLTLQAFKAQGLTQRQMVEELNRLRVPPARGGDWSLMQLQRVLKRLTT